MLVGGAHSNLWDTPDPNNGNQLEVDGDYHPTGFTNAVNVGTTGQLSPIPVWTVSGFNLEQSSCTQGSASCEINIGASASGNGTAWAPPYTGSSPRWRYRCGLSSTELWSDASACDGLSTCSITDACDFQAASPGTYTVKIYSEPGPGAGIRVSDHDSLTFTVN